ncbi:glycosyltransferase family 15 protein [Wickerhamomyces anomalus NRRL Y-366-8]|uniref:Glycosyltransferase family 15 protein n=1 Tax=Wickerhamomyces anomalus (strain ATCC 58044 / CBS 1984 / NCYC 433 / NRRL Y-366-8) TaxID=683960 RepID=A0A1E3NYB5_WICAA|nr:glycosyltransferase family 15 protein [Wickerhamomyces anomalus NRRL Y-366-8]ODQ57567.1 glycosyltransferase family 15 protein [Wickerhamomyces anomalus NRRL Y-366-8]
MRFFQKVWIVITCIIAILFQSSSFLTEKLNSVVYEQNLFKTYFENIRQIKTFHYDPERKFLTRPATNSYSQKILVDESRDDITPGRENATIVMLVRNWELDQALESMRSLEDRFNKKYRYPWTFLNDVPFDAEFIEATSLMASGETEYGLIPSEDWNRPPWINETQFEESLQQMTEAKVLYGDSRSYRNMCRFNSGFFYKQQLLQKYEWYFRVEPSVQYYCDFNYDPFQVMRLNGKKYGFIIAIHEYEETIPTLYDTVMDFIEENPQYLHPNSSIDFITDMSSLSNMHIRLDLANDYNLCHFWSNFEIGNLDFFRSEAYEAFFNYLDKKGGFYYERWGDAPVHTLGVSLLMDKDEIHYFEDIGYYHGPFGNCPSSNALRLSKRCVCDPQDESVVDIEEHSCIPRWWKVGGKTFLKDKGTF